MPKPSVVFAPNSAEKLKQGFDTLANLLAIKLGPSQGIVLSTKDTPGPPDVLSDAATIARRMIALPDRQTDVGAMLLRNTVWRVHQRVGDGTATTAVLAQAMLASAYRMVVAGASAVAMQRGMERAGAVVLQQLREMAAPADNWETLAAVGHAVTGRQDLGDALGELAVVREDHDAHGFLVEATDRVDAPLAAIADQVDGPPPALARRQAP